MTPYLLNLLKLILYSIVAAGEIEDVCTMHKSVYDGRGNNIILKDIIKDELLYLKNKSDALAHAIMRKLKIRPLPIIINEE